MLVRFLAEMQLESIVSTGTAIERFTGKRVRLERTLFFLVILRESAHFRSASTGLASGRAPETAGISVNAIASTLKRPFETTRRHVHALIDDGMCVRTDVGVTVSLEAMGSEAVGWLLTQLHDVTVRFFVHLAEFDFRATYRQTNKDYDPIATIAAGIDLVLDTAQVQIPHHNSWIEMLIMYAVSAFGARSIAFDPELSKRYGDGNTVPPPELRAGLTAPQLARVLKLPVTTVARQLAASEAGGKLIRDRDGYKASMSLLSGPIVVAGGLASVMRVARARARLAPAGFNFDDPASNYIGAPPPLLKFD